MPRTTSVSSPSPSFITTLRGFLPSIIVNGVLPYVIFQLLKSYTSASDLLALIISALPAIISGLFGIIRQRQMDLIAAVTLVGIAVSIIVAFVGGDPRLFLIRESFLTLALGIACLVSLLFPKPLWFYIFRYFASASNSLRTTEFNANWQYAGFRSFIRILTLVWGVTFVGEFILRVILVYNMSIAQFLALSPFIFYGIIIAVIAFTFVYSNHARRRGEELRRKRQESFQAQNVEAEQTVG
jgi:hypothetical protein